MSCRSAALSSNTMSNSAVLAVVEAVGLVRESDLPVGVDSETKK